MINNCFKSRHSESALKFFLVTLALFALIASAFLLPKDAFCAQLTLTWDPVTGSGLAGYKVHYGTASKNYPSVVNAGNQTSATVTGLNAGTTYYFAATAYNTAGTESAYSNEVAYTVPASCSYAISPASASFTATGGTGSVAVSTSGGCSWTTSNSSSWVTITSGTSGTGNGTIKYSVSGNTGSSSRTAGLTLAGAAFTVTQSAGSGGSAYTITASAGSGGSISPSGGVSVNAGASQSFAISPSSGYRVSAVTVDGASVGAVTSYTFTNVRANHTISATFAATSTSYTLTITKSGTGNGTVTNSPSGSTFAAGTVVNLTAAPDANSTFSGWSGGCSGTATTSTVTINGNVTVTATFAAKSTSGGDVWPSTTTPQVADGGPDSAVELGVKFRSDVAGTITGIRFYKASTNTGTHVGNLWTSTGTLLATATFTSETTSGWQQVNFSTPVPITANTVYVASYHTNAGHYACDQNYFASKGVDTPPLHLLANGVSGYNGVYAYGSTSSFPSQGWNASNYWVDVVFSASQAPQTNYTLWQSTTTPGVADGGPDGAVELGVKFRSDSNGYISGVRFYKASTNTGTHVANLWSSTGTLLATATFTSETSSGWQQVNFSSRVPITANTYYVASYHTNVGHYGCDQNYFASKGVDTAPLHAPANGVSGYNGVYAYGSTSSFPSQGWNSSNYWVDVVFQTQ